MSKINRRQFNKLLGASLTAIPVMAVTVATNTQAADTPLVDPASPTAQGLKYMEVSDQEGKSCASCALYVAEEGADNGQCALFPGASVKGTAWCSAYAPKPS